MNILDKIIVDKEEKSFSKSIIPVSQLEACFFQKDYIIK
jgi:hypothetical protein